MRAIAIDKNRDPADLWQILMLERFLVRLAHSPYRNHFVLKGAILLSKYIEIGRETRDLDFSAQKISNELEKLTKVFEEITSIDLRDGFSFREVQVGQLIHPHMNYSGVKALMMAYFGKVRSRVTIDVGFGDIVQPVEQSIPLIHSAKGALFESTVQLSCYPKEFIFAEKLETLVYRKYSNSRMKDFHDLHSLISISESQPFTNLNQIIHAVFTHRQTPFSLPIAFEEEGIAQLQKLWSAYLKNLRTQNLPQNVSEVLLKINNWLRANL